MRGLSRVGRLFRITNGFEAGFVIYALALGAAMRGEAYRMLYPGAFGWALYAAALLAVLMAGAAIIDGVAAVRKQENRPERFLRVVLSARGRQRRA